MISVIIITKNEEARIRPCLESVKWADEIVVADTGATDQTLKIAREYTKNIFTCQGNDFTSWRNEAGKKAKGDWLLYVDTDERVLTTLREEILKITSKDDFSAYAISRKNIIFGSEQKYSAFWPDWVIRLLKKEDFQSWVGKVHEYPIFSGKLGYSKSSFIHLTHRNIDQVILKSLSWSNIDVKLRLEANHPKMSSWRFLRILFSELFIQGIIRRGFFAGTIGTIDALMQSFSLVITYIRLWEMQQKPSLEEKYKKIDSELMENKFNYP